MWPKRGLRTAPKSYISGSTLASGGSTGKRVGSKVNDKDANLASYWNIVGFRKTILCRDLKPVRAQIFISPGDLLALFPNWNKICLSHAGHFDENTEVI
jgi:hypothetical protein